MKLSSILKPLAALFFWTSITWGSYSFLNPGYPLYLEILATVIIWVGCFAIRNSDNGKAHIILHGFVLIGICFVQYGYILFSIPLFAIHVLHVVLSFFARLKKLDYMEMLTGTEITFWAFLYIAFFIVGNVDMLVAYLIFASLIMLRFVQNIAIRNEKHLEIISEYSVINRGEMQNNSNRMTLVTGGIMFVCCIAFGLLGRLPVFSTFLTMLRKNIWKIINIIKGFNKSNIRIPETTTEAITVEFDTGEPEQYVDETPFSTVWTVIGVIGFVLTVCWILFCIIERIVKRKKVYMPDFDEEVKVTKTEKIAIRKKKEKPEDYSYRKAIRRMYRNKIKKGRGKRNDDLISKTPIEHRLKKIEEGYEVSEGFVDMYERARYSNERVTREDVKRVQNERK